MGYIILDKIKNNNKKIMIFVEGTILKPKHKNIFSRIHMLGYVPINNAIRTLNKWQEEGYEIIYITSLRGRKAMKMARHIDALGFEGSMVGYREKNQTYATLIKEEMPNILIEDDWASVGGKAMMCYEELPDEIKGEIKHIVVKEFEGIDDIKLYEDRNITLEEPSDKNKRRNKENDNQSINNTKSSNKKKNKRKSKKSESKEK